MGADYSKEYPSTWQQQDVLDWKKKALETLKIYYSNFAGTQWHEFDRSKDTDLLRIKICYAMFGPPTIEKGGNNDSDGFDGTDLADIENAYSDEQQKRAQAIVEVILSEYDNSPVSQLRVGFIFVSCKQEANEFVLPVFSVYIGKDGNGNDERHFIDSQCRTYKSWEDWKQSNCLPMLKYCYPERGYFTCSGGASYKFDEDRDPDVDYGTSPQCNITSRVFRQTDNVTSVASIGSGVIGIAALFTPLAPVVLTVAAVAGTSSAAYGACRGTSRLVDKGRHGQSLVDFESCTIWLSLVATPFHFITSAVNGTLAMGAQQGRIFSKTMRMVATVLNFTTLGLDTAFFTFGLANLINKAINKELTGLDILQFSMSAFFFTNTLIQPRVASKIIRRAQEMHFDKMANTMTDDTAKQAFKSFLDQNQSGGSITDRSKIVRTINRMADPNKFFKSVGPDATVNIGGRKGKTVLVSDHHGHTNRIQPNKFDGMFTQQNATSGTYNFKKDEKRLKECYGTDHPEDVELNGVKIFENLDDNQKRSIGRTVGGTAKSNRKIIGTAHKIAEEMGCKTSDELMGIIEIVAKEVEGKVGENFTSALDHISSASGREQFVNGIKSDLSVAVECANKADLNFDSPLKAVYHYRKHGPDFASAIKKFGNEMEVYLGPVKDQVFDKGNLREVCTLNDGIVREIYASKSDKFGVITSTPDGAKISTMFVKPGAGADYSRKLAEFFSGHVAAAPPEPISDVAARVARFLGFRAFHINITVAGGDSTPHENCASLDPKVHEHIAQLLNALAA